jgi:hypothetical protein
MAKKLVTEKTVRVPLVGSPTNRDVLVEKDQRFVNCYPEVINNRVTGADRVYLVKRAGLEKWTRPSSASGEGRGLTVWNNKVYSVIGTKLWETDIVTKVSTEKQTLTTSTGAVGFTDTTGANDYLFLCDTVKGYVISTTGVVTEITDADFPTPHVALPTFMDGYVFLLKTNGDICNSVVEDPLSWDASNFIVPESFPDPCIGLARQNNMVVALNTNSVEFFYDAGNATGSPLAVAPQYTLQFGCASIGSITQEEALICFVAQSSTGGYFVTACEGFKPTNISTEPINRILDAEGDYIIDSWAYLVRQRGHFFYVLNLPYQRRTLCYDFVVGMWHEWSWTVGAEQDMFPFSWRSVIESNPAFLHETDGYIYLMKPSLYRDDGNAISVQIQTSRFDNDSSKLKFMSKIEFIADRQTTASTMSVRYSDDDYQSWTSPRTVSLTDRAVLWRLGSFRRRAFLFIHESNTPFRIEAVEMDLDQGTH